MTVTANSAGAANQSVTANAGEAAASVTILEQGRVGGVGDIGRGAGKALAGAVSVSYDEDAQTYFDALEAASGWSEPADYADKKTAISDYFTNLKADNNFTDIKAMYIPIWRVAGPNAINAVNPGTYDLTFNGTVTHNGGDYIYGDDSTGYATAAFRGPGATSGSVFMGLTDFSWGGNIVDYNSTSNYSTLCGWRREGNIVPYHSATYVRASAWRYAQYLLLNITPVTGLHVAQSIAPTGANTNALELYRAGSSAGTAHWGTYQLASKTNDWSILAGQYNSAQYDFSKHHVNFAFAGTELTSVSDFNTDTATFLAAI